MTCNCFEYHEMTEKMFYGVALTDEHLNAATERIRIYLVNGGAAPIMAALHIGIKVITKEYFPFSELNQVLRRRFVWLDGERKGQELSIAEIQGIGMFLEHGCYYGRLMQDGTITQQAIL